MGKIPKISMDAFKEIQEKIATPYLEGFTEKGRDVLEKYIKRFKEDQPLLFDWFEGTLMAQMKGNFEVNMGTVLLVMVLINESLKVQAEINEINDMLK